MQIDESDEHAENADLGMLEISHPFSKSTLKTVSRPAKQPDPNVSIQQGITTSDSVPKYNTSDVDSKSRRKCS
jgi:hypothetical protein